MTLSPVCVRLCLSSWLRLAKAFTQEEQLKTLGFWELGDGPGWCTRSCSCRQIQNIYFSLYSLAHKVPLLEQRCLSCCRETDTLFEQITPILEGLDTVTITSKETLISHCVFSLPLVFHFLFCV